MRKIHVRRIDLGWRNLGGNYGVVATPDGPLTEQLHREMLGWSDRSREDLREHWFWVGLGGSDLGLMRITPQEGGARGMASTMQALVLSRADVPWGTDLRPLLDLFPPAPARIAEGAAWGTQRVAVCPALGPIGALFQQHELALASLVAQLNGERLWTLPAPRSYSLPIDEVRDALLMFSLCPKSASASLMPRFGTRSAPSETYLSVFRFGDADTRHLPGYAEAEKWVQVGIFLDSPQIADLDPLTSDSVGRQLLSKALATNPPDALAVAGIFSALGRQAHSRNALQEIVIDCLSDLSLPARGQWVTQFLNEKVAMDEAGVPALLPWKLLADLDAMESFFRHQPDRFADFAPQLMEKLPGSIERAAPRMSAALRGCFLRCLHQQVSDGPMLSPWLNARHGEAFRVLLFLTLDEIESSAQLGRGASLEACRLIQAGLSAIHRPPPELGKAIADAFVRIAHSFRLFGHVLIDCACDTPLFLIWFSATLPAVYGDDRRAAAVFVVRTFNKLNRMGRLRPMQSALARAATHQHSTSQRTVLALVCRAGHSACVTIRPTQ